jgi:hypothetical protein
MEQSNLKVRVGCDTMLKIIKELDENIELQEIFGKPVSGALAVIAEGGDLRIEDGGALELSNEHRRKFLEILESVVNAKGLHKGVGGAGGERVRVRCDILESIIKDLDRNGELNAIFGGRVSEALVVIAEGDDLRIEVGDTIKLTEGQSSVFLGILNHIVEDRTAIEEKPHTA